MSGERIRQRALGVPGVQGTHSVFQLSVGSGGQLPQDLPEHVACVPHVVEGAAAA
ncbi:hypothetical protein [Streptomyces sp. NPDC096311]|uniref:hypothetical protein n=1 Tax=Streptomyces sp. NPDC096311 TaxID=3366083 RepID=UPI003825D6C5